MSMKAAMQALQNQCEALKTAQAKSLQSVESGHLQVREELRSQCQDLLKSKRLLEEALNIKDKEAENRQKELIRVRTMSDLAQQENAALISKINAALSESARKFNQSSEECNALKKLLEDANAKLTQSNSECAHFKSAYEEAMSNVSRSGSEMATTLQQTSDECRTLKLANQSLQDRVSESTQRISELEMAQKTALEQVARDNTTKREELLNIQSTLKASLERNQEVLTANIRESDNMKKQIRDLQKENTDLLVKLETSNTKLCEVESAFHQSKVQASDVQLKYSNLVDSRATVARQLDELRTKHEENQAINTYLTSRLKEAEEKIYILEQQQLEIENLKFAAIQTVSQV
jgi:chromosome segregation ATPase